MIGVETPRANNGNFDPHAYFQQSFINRMIGFARPNLGGVANNTCYTTVGLSLNCVALTSFSNVTAGIPSNTVPIFKNTHKRFQLGANANLTTGNATIFANANTFWVGGTGGTAASNGGGFLYSIRFAYDAVGSNVRSFIGLSNATSTMVPAAVDYEPRTNTVYSVFGVGANVSSAGNLWLIYGTAGSARTATDLGNKFVINTSDVFELIVAVPPGGGSVGYRIRNLNNGAETQGIVTSGIPAANTFLNPVVLLKSNTTAVSNISIMNIYSESDQ